MTITYGFYNSLAGDRKYDAVQLSRLFEGIITDGIFQSIGNALAVTHIASTMTVNVDTGRAWFYNTWTNNDSNLVLTVLASEAVLNRVDSVILEVNTDTGVRANSIKVLKGTPASTPVAPTLANTSTLKQYTLADIYVGAGVTSIGAGNITNKRGSVGTPFITGILDTIDVTTLFAQYDAQFNYWFANLVNQLSGSQVTNLQNQINSLNSGWTSYTTVVPTRITSDSPTFVLSFAGVSLTSVLSVGMKVKWTQNATTRYGIITAISFSTNTSLTIYTGTDYVVDDTATYAVSNFAYSAVKSPYGFPTNPDKWTVVVDNTTLYTKTTPTASSWYNAMDSGNLPSIIVPIGSWSMYYEAYIYASKAAATSVNIFVTLSTAQGSESDNKWTAGTGIGGASGTLVPQVSASKRNSVLMAAKTTLYLNIKTNTGADNINLTGTATTTKIRAVCSYL